MQLTLSTGNGASTLALKPMGGVNQSLKQSAPVAPQNGVLSPQKFFSLPPSNIHIWSTGMGYWFRTEQKSFLLLCAPESGHKQGHWTIVVALADPRGNPGSATVLF